MRWGRARQVVVLSHSKPLLCALWEGADAPEAVKALIVANEYLESEVCDLMQAVSPAYVRGRLKTYTGGVSWRGHILCCAAVCRQ
jgi:hypothetical protein